MIKHFEELWEQCEDFHKNSLNNSTSQEDLNELSLKFSFYKKLMEKESNEEGLKKAKSRMMGEILFLLTKFSLKDDVNTFTALKEVLEYKEMEKSISFGKKLF